MRLLWTTAQTVQIILTVGVSMRRKNDVCNAQQIVWTTMRRTTGCPKKGYPFQIQISTLIQANYCIQFQTMQLYMISFDAKFATRRFCHWNRAAIMD